jgi:hypothetical protein
MEGSPRETRPGIQVSDFRCSPRFISGVSLYLTSSGSGRGGGGGEPNLNWWGPSLPFLEQSSSGGSLIDLCFIPRNKAPSFPVKWREVQQCSYQMWVIFFMRNPRLNATWIYFISIIIGETQCEHLFTQIKDALQKM